MKRQTPMRSRRSPIPAVLAALAGAALAAPAPAAADPPPWAPAHGYRAKHGHKGAVRVAPSTTVVVAPPAEAPVVRLENCNRELIGSVIGGAAGAAVGSQIGQGTGRVIATATGTVIGFLIGGAIGRSMDEADRSCVGRVLETAETGQTVAWRNPDGAVYEVTPQRTYAVADGRYCREFQTQVKIGGKVESAHGTACRQPDGSWQTQP